MCSNNKGCERGTVFMRICLKVELCQSKNIIIVNGNNSWTSRSIRKYFTNEFAEIIYCCVWKKIHE